MTTRFLLGCGVLIVAFIVLRSAFSESLLKPYPDLLLNLGTELIGIVITVLIVDWLFERRRNQDEAQKIAQSALIELDHHVWVWQGGARGFDLAELLYLLNGVQDKDYLPSFTENMFLQLGSKSSDTLSLRNNIVTTKKQLKKGLKELSKLTAIRDSNDRMPPSEIANHLIHAVKYLVDVAGYSLPEPKSDSPSKYCDSSLERQEWRHYGRD